MVCRGQLVELASKRYLFDRRDVKLMAISVDPPETSHRLSLRLGGPDGLGYPLLSDPERVVISKFGVAMEDEPIAVPAVFILAPGGRIVWSHVGENVGDRPTVQKILYELDRARGG